MQPGIMSQAISMFKALGFVGLLMLFVGVALFVAGIVVLAVARRQRTAWIFLALTALPLLLGLAGTALGYARAHQVVSATGPIADPHVLEVGLALARLSVYFGGVISALLAALAVAALAATRARQRAVEGG